MRRKLFPPWMWGFCWAIAPAAMTAVIVAHQLEPTHALGHAPRASTGSSLSALRTDQALWVDTRSLETGPLVEGDEVHVQVLVQNVWQRGLALDVALLNLPGWTARLDKPVLNPGDATLLHLSGSAESPGELDGVVHITALGDYLSLRVAVRGQVSPRPEPPACPAGEVEGGVITTESDPAAAENEMPPAVCNEGAAPAGEEPAPSGRETPAPTGDEVSASPEAPAASEQVPVGEATAGPVAEPHRKGCRPTEEGDEREAVDAHRERGDYGAPGAPDPGGWVHGPHRQAVAGWDSHLPGLQGALCD